MITAENVAVSTVLDVQNDKKKRLLPAHLPYQAIQALIDILGRSTLATLCQQFA